MSECVTPRYAQSLCCRSYSDNTTSFVVTLPLSSSIDDRNAALAWEAAFVQVWAGLPAQLLPMHLSIECTALGHQHRTSFQIVFLFHCMVRLSHAASSGG
jgi:hypothetical protein